MPTPKPIPKYIQAKVDRLERQLCQIVELYKKSSALDEEVWAYIQTHPGVRGSSIKSTMGSDFIVISLWLDEINSLVNRLPSGLARILDQREEEGAQ